MEVLAVDRTNIEASVKLLERTLERVRSGEVRSFMIIEDCGPHGMDACWSSAADKFAISAYAIGAALARMGFVRAGDGAEL